MMLMSVLTALPAPHPRHLAAATPMWDRMVEGAKRLHAAYGPGLIALVLEPKAGDWRLGFTPRHQADLSRVMAMGVSEAAAETIIDRVASYNPSVAAKMLVVEEGYSPENPFSFIEFELA